VFAINPRFVQAALAALVLGGCASAGSYWETDAKWVNFKPTDIVLLEPDDPSIICRKAPHSVLGCAILQPEINTCTVVLKSRLPRNAFSCALTHEMRHCLGDFHTAYNDRPHYALDCGDGTLYSGPMQAGG
jgi:hypothetical protein